MHRYIIVDKICSGLFSDVYKGIDQVSKEYVAIKRVFACTELEFSNIKMEFYRMCKVNCQNVVKYIDLIVQPKYCDIIMEYISGWTLKQVFQQQSQVGVSNSPETTQNLSSFPFDLSQAQRDYIGSQIVNTVIYLHDIGIIHRDLHYENILVTPELLIKIIDFSDSIYKKV
ncbi:Kinase [Hexamita inflata]|uniref:Kinase n=1 Tax=Hexamita inflata TaxID=28002 RepID=A0AA86NKK1_9EUKA|nr:Kinase [Hexamita inflata]CAI9940530.1 Kinase [Hexamita inflata]CAI9953499.1 Kinase [Hexamita inflata]